MNKYKVRWLIDDTYQVLNIGSGTDLSFDEFENPEVLHQGSLSDCESFIRLKEGGYL
jgi:hypothetical protein